MHFSKLAALVVVAALSAQGILAVEYVCGSRLQAYCCAFQTIRQPKITPFITDI